MAKVNQQTVTILTMNPLYPDMWKTPLYIFLLPVMRLVRMGTRYAQLLMVTAEPSKELKAVLDPRYRQPSATTIAVTANCEFIGICKRWLTFDQVFEKGSAPSRENAQNMRPVDN